MLNALQRFNLSGDNKHYIFSDDAFRIYCFALLCFIGMFLTRQNVIPFSKYSSSSRDKQIQNISHYKSSKYLIEDIIVWTVFYIHIFTICFLMCSFSKQNYNPICVAHSIAHTTCVAINLNKHFHYHPYNKKKSNNILNQHERHMGHGKSIFKTWESLFFYRSERRCLFYI